MKLLLIFAVILFTGVVKSSDDLSHGPVDCAMGSSSCESCHAAYPFCYWCDGKCRQYFGKNFAKLECRGKVMYERCEDNEQMEPDVEEILSMMGSLKKEHKSKPDFSRIEERGNELLTKGKYTSQKSKLKRLLHLLKMLAYVQKVKSQRHHGLVEAATSKPFNSVDNELLKLGENPEMIKNSIKGLYPDKHKSSNSDLDDLLEMVNHKRHKEHSNLEESGKLSASVSAMALNSSKKAKIKTVKHTSASINSEATTLPISTRVPVTTLTNLSTPKETAGNSAKYCQLFEQEDECNGDQDCSWCNILDLCVGRNKEDFKRCTGSKRNEEINAPISDESNVCAGRTSCASCTKKGKCYWCEKTKSCHIYPFFGFIPHNCPTNMWYYKECDVQLAIFIILFPLLMILLSMGIFYVCLRYCYYRRRTLKVQLFEKPEIFEQKKGKKVYFVGGDDEDEELRSEQIRKKYNLPQEKEPLITP